MCEMKINNLSVHVKIFSLFKLIFKSISGNCDPLFSQTDFDHTHFRGFLSRFFARGFCPRDFCPGVYVLEPYMQNSGIKNKRVSGGGGGGEMHPPRLSEFLKAQVK